MAKDTNRMKLFDINCDLGEGAGNDELLIPYIDACSIACGGHTGDHESMTKTIHLALEYNTEIGAHPSFPDKENFGRKPMRISPSKLADSLFLQVKTLHDLCLKSGASLKHIKLHGALYNMTSSDIQLTQVVLQALNDFKHVPFIAPQNSIFTDECRRTKIPVRVEAFADRHYDDSGKLVPRNHTNAVITNPEESVEQVLSIAKQGYLKSLNGTIINCTAETFCIHGDNPNAVQILQVLKHNQFE